MIRILAHYMTCLLCGKQFRSKGWKLTCSKCSKK